MIRKSMIASLALLSLFALAPETVAPARADVDLDIRLNLGYGGWGVIGVPRRGNCRQGRRIVDRRFNNVRPAECSGRYYTYYGSRNYNLFVITLDSYSGRIVDVQRSRRR